MNSLFKKIPTSEELKTEYIKEIIPFIVFLFPFILASMLFVLRLNPDIVNNNQIYLSFPLIIFGGTGFIMIPACFFASFKQRSVDDKNLLKLKSEINALSQNNTAKELTIISDYKKIEKINRPMMHREFLVLMQTIDKIK